MKRKSILLASLMLTLLLSNKAVFAKDVNNEKNTGIPKSVQEKIDKKIADSQYDLKDIEAYEIDLNGNKTKVQPKSQQFYSAEQNTNGVTTFAVPNDGYRYVFYKYNASSATRNWYFKSNGTFRFSNKLSTIQQATYTQQATTTSAWRVGTNISGSTTVGNGFLAGVEIKCGLDAERSKTWTAGRTYGGNINVPGKTVAYITNYQVGINSSGGLLWSKYHSSGANVGYYSESGSGTAIDNNSLNIEVTDTAPL